MQGKIFLALGFRFIMVRNVTKKLIVLLLLLDQVTSFAEPFAESSELLQDLIQVSDDPALNANMIFADKTERKLYVLSANGKVIQSYEIDIGKNGGNKTRRDDKKTPEGIYLLQVKKTQPEIPFDLYGSLALTTNYPNIFDKAEKKTGDGIWLHSVPDTVPLNRGSRGCVVVRNENIKKISELVSLNKSYLMINDQARRVSQAEHDALKKIVLEWFNQWKADWESQKIDSYMKHYSEKFTAPDFNLATWKSHKERLKNKYKSIEVKIGMPTILHQKNQYVVRFRQNYKSDLHQDEGLKTLFVVKENDLFKILREEWDEIKN